MADNNEEIGYGYTENEGEQKSGQYHFGLNQGKARLMKFEFTPNGGKDGAPQEAIDIVINVGGRDISYKQFPVTKVYYKNQVIENTHPEFKTELKKAVDNFSGVCTHIIKCFVKPEIIAAAMSRKTANFQDYVSIYQNLLPKGFQDVPLDIFMQWQWQISGTNNRTFLEIPRKIIHGKFLVPAVKPVGKWSELISDEQELSYVDDAGNKHPFERNKWFMTNNFAKQQKEGGDEESSEAPAAANFGTTPSANVTPSTAPGVDAPPATEAPKGWG